MRAPLLLVVLPIGALGCRPTLDACGEVETWRYDEQPGVAPELLALDLVRPAGVASPPLVVWVHGGGWKGGDKRGDVGDKCALVTGLGAAFASVNYRLSREADAGEPGHVAWPDHANDVATAVAWLHDQPLGLDVSRIVLLGHSAGAQIVANLGTDGSFLGAHGLALSDLAGVGSYDTDAYDVPQMMADFENPVYLSAFGRDPGVWEDASALAHVEPGKGIPPFQLARRGVTARTETCDAFADALRAAGGRVDVIDASSLDHEGVNHAIGRPRDRVMTPHVTRFLEEALGLRP